MVLLYVGVPYTLVTSCTSIVVVKDASYDQLEVVRD